MKGTFHTLLAVIIMTVKSGIINLFQVRRLSQEVVKPGFQGREAGKASCDNLINHVSVILSFLSRGGKGLESSILLSSSFHLGVVLFEQLYWLLSSLLGQLAILSS